MGSMNIDNNKKTLGDTTRRDQWRNTGSAHALPEPLDQSQVDKEIGSVTIGGNCDKCKFHEAITVRNIAAVDRLTRPPNYGKQHLPEHCSHEAL